MMPARCSHTLTTAALWKVLWQHMSPFLTMQTGLFALTFANWDNIRAAGALTLCYRQVCTVPPNNLFKISCAMLHDKSHHHVRREWWEPFYGMQRSRAWCGTPPILGVVNMVGTRNFTCYMGAL